MPIQPTFDSQRSAQRPALSLDGLWEFVFNGPTARLLGEGRRTRSPAVWQARFPELRNTCGTGRYRRRIEIPPEWAGQRVTLVMEGSFHETTIRIDDRPVAVHGDGWTEIEVDLTTAIEGKSAFVLGVEATIPDDRGPASGRLSQSLIGKQDWYGLHGGIWKSARLEARNPAHLRRVALRTSFDLKTCAVTVSGALSRPIEAAMIRITLSRMGSRIARRDCDARSVDFELRLEVAGAEPWAPEAPNLYEAAIELICGGAVVDAVERVVGFRSLEARDSRLILNGRPFYMFGALDQDWRLDEESGPPGADFLEQRFRNAKAMGLNALRCHVKIPDRLYFDLADRLGLMVWLDMPYAEFLAPSTREAVRDVFGKVVATHGHHPSICIWTLFNEGWGIDLDDNPDDRRWLIETFETAKALVPDGLLIDNSPCFPRNYHCKTDIEDFHWYNAFPHQNDQFAATARAFASRAAWAWSPHGDAEKRGDEPLICSEFGVWGLPHPRDLLNEDGSEPWWFESGHDWNLGAAYPHGLETRFRDAQLAPIFGNLDRFVDAAQELQYRALKFQIEVLRWEAPISGYVITELNDVQWEANGLMDVWNHPRRFAERLADLQQPWLIIARVPRTAIRVGESIDVPIRLAGAGKGPEGAKLVWRFADQTGVEPLGPEPIAIRLVGCAGEAIAIHDLELEASDADGRVLSRNRVEFCVVPPLRGPAPTLHAIDAGARTIVSAIGWPNGDASLEEADIVLATRLTTPVRQSLLGGRKVVLIANSDEALIDPERDLPISDRHNFPTMELRRRAGTPWDGQWMGAFAWRRVDGPWAGLPNGPMLDEHWAGLLPDYVLTGFLSTAFGGLIDSGVAVGWLHLAAAFAKRSFLGRGWMTASTFELSSKAALENPLAPHLLRALAES